MVYCARARCPFVCQMEEVLDIDKKLYDPQYPQVCMDEMLTQLSGEVRARLPAIPGKPLRYDTEYKRNGIANFFIAFEPLMGQRYTKVRQSGRKLIGRILSENWLINIIRMWRKFDW